MFIDGVDIFLMDDGTLDTVVEVNHQNGTIEDLRLSADCAGIYRDENGDFTDESFQEFCENEVIPYLEAN